MRNLIILIFIGILLALARWLIVDVISAVKRATGSDSDKSRRSGDPKASEASQAGRLVRDPVSGTYIDERMAVKADIDGETFYFESRDNRDAYLKKSRAG